MPSFVKSAGMIANQHARDGAPVHDCLCNRDALYGAVTMRLGSHSRGYEDRFLGPLEVKLPDFRPGCGFMNTQASFAASLEYGK